MNMEPHGFLRQKLDVKVLCLYITARLDAPLDVDELFEVAFQDESLNYFTMAECLLELTDSGHLERDDRGRYTITEKGREQGGYVEDSLPLSVVQKVDVAIREKNHQILMDERLKTSVSQDQDGNWLATLDYRDTGKPLMKITLLAPNENHASIMAKNMKRDVAKVYKAAYDAATTLDKKRSDPF